MHVAHRATSSGQTARGMCARLSVAYTSPDTGVRRLAPMTSIRGCRIRRCLDWGVPPHSEGHSRSNFRWTGPSVDHAWKGAARRRALPP